MTAEMSNTMCSKTVPWITKLNILYKNAFSLHKGIFKTNKDPSGSDAIDTWYFYTKIRTDDVSNFYFKSNGTMIFY